MKTYCLFFSIVFTCTVVSAITNDNVKNTKAPLTERESDQKKNNPGISLSGSSEFTIRYKSVDDLIVIPVIINDSISVNLILDTGCRNIVIFGKRFQKLFDFNGGRNVAFSGLGSGKHVQGKVSINNRLSIGKVQGNCIPIVVVPERNIFDCHKNIHGVIGYDIFIKLEVEVHPLMQLISFRPGLNDRLHAGYAKIPIRIVDSKPVLQSRIVLPGEQLEMDLFIDTGSTLGLFLKSSDETRFRNPGKVQLLGKGLNGLVKGVLTEATSLKLGQQELVNVPLHFTYASHDNGSVGMDLLKKYSIVINYARGFVGLMETDLTSRLFDVAHHQ